MIKTVLMILVIAIVILGLVYIFDIVYGALASVRHIIAVNTNTTEETGYSSTALSYVSQISPIIILIIIGVFIVYNIHTKKR